MQTDIQPILDRVLSGERLTSDDCTALLESNDFVRIGLAAHEIRMRHNPTDVVTYIIDRNINYTNVCNVVCTFCAFYRRPGKPDTYVHSIEEICKRIDETIELGGTGVLMQGGLHPDFNIEWYEDLLTTLHAKYPGFQLHCFSPPEIHNIHLISGLDYETVMLRLKAAGLNSLPGGGGEILDDEVRKRVSTKCNTQEWLDVMRAVHKVGLRSTATMMFGIGDNISHRVKHLQRVRDVQDETGGFTAFIPWTFQRENTALGRKIKEEPTGIDYLQMLAVSRLVSRQHPAHPVLLAHAGAKARPDRSPFRSRRHGLHHDRRKCRLRRRGKHLRERTRPPLPDPRSRLYPAAERYFVQLREPRRDRRDRQDRFDEAETVERGVCGLGTNEIDMVFESRNVGNSWSAGLQ